MAPHGHLTRALATVKDLHGGQAWVRGDSAFATAKNVAAAVKGRAWFSFTVPTWVTATRAISTIPDDAWTPIVYPRAVRDEDTGELISQAQVAETSFVVFGSRPKAEQVTCRLIVRRVKRLGYAPARAARQGELFQTWRHHAFITNTTLDAVEADKHHRGHAIVEQVIAVPARLARTGRRLLVHLPRHWPWSAAWANLWDTATSPPSTATT